MGGVTAVFEMPNTDPLTSPKDLSDKIGAAPPHALRFCVLHRGTRENVQDCRNWKRAPGCAGVKVSSAPLPAAQWCGRRRKPAAHLRVIKRRAAFHAETEYRLNERKPLRVEGDPRRTGMARRDRGAAGDANSLSYGARDGKRITCCISRPGRRSSICAITRTSRLRGDAASSDIGWRRML